MNCNQLISLIHDVESSLHDFWRVPHDEPISELLVAVASLIQIPGVNELSALEQSRLLLQLCDMIRVVNEGKDARCALCRAESKPQLKLRYIPLHDDRDLIQ